MGIISDALNKKAVPVFGTHSYTYNTAEFDRARDDGFSIVDLMPECRVFVGGAEVTKDVITTAVNHEMSGGIGGGSTGGGSTCTITLTNPKGKFEISKTDLTGKWREDKDVLAMYDYTYLNKDTGFDLKNALWNFLDSQQLANVATDTIRGVSGSPIVGAIGGAALSHGLKAIKNANAPKAITRMLYEVKHVSGLYKQIGDIVFDYKDPVYVFMKGRFSPLWYFAFSGIVTNWTESESYGDSSTISLKCESVLYLLKKTKLTQRGALFPAGNFETMVMDNNTKTQTDFCDSMTGASLRDMIKAIIFGRDLRDNVLNNHISGNTANYYESSLTYEQQYTSGSASTGAAGLKSDKYPVFGDKFNTSVSNLDMSSMNLSDITNSASGPNSLSLGPWQQAYFQYNEFAIHDSTNLHYYYEDSVRFWEKDFALSTAYNDGTKTGWDDKDAFGVLGMHPALNYIFIDSFGILFNVWKCINNNVKSPMSTNAALSSLTLSPYDKIIESVAGASTEAAQPNNMGTNLNTFRPRVFLVLPQKYAADHPVSNNAMGAFQVFKSSATTVYDLLTTGVSSLDYAVYTTPMGDLVIEPNWYDTHPLEHWPAGNSIVLRNTTKTAEIKAVAPENATQGKYTTPIKAYDYKDTNTHPYFVMLKDTGTFAQEFSPELIKTKITVRGRATDMSATHGVASQIGQAVSNPDLDPLFLATNSNSLLAPGFYIAHGFSSQLINIMSSLAQYQGVFTAQAKRAFTTYATEHFFNNITYFITLTFAEYYALVLKDALVQNSQSIITYYNTEVSQPMSSTTPNDTSVYPLGLDINLAPLTSLYDFLNSNVTSMFESSVNSLSETDQEYIALNSPNCLTKITDSTGNINIDAAMGTIVPRGNYSYIDYTKNPLPCITELINMYQIGLLYGSNAVGTDIEIGTARKLFQSASSATSKTPNIAKSIRTLGDLKRLAVAGLYNPQLDVVRRYGYNTNATEIVNPYIANGAEAKFYATVVFLKLFSGAFTFHLGTIGRPEYSLNRTYYCQRKDAIGLLTKYSLGWTYGAESTSDIDLTYIRKNAATFSYSLGDLDILTSKGSANNKSLQDAAEKYYAWQKLSSVLTNKASSLTNTAATGLASSLHIPASAVVGDEVAGVVGSAISKINIGGMYSVHPCIGHMDFSKSAITDTVVAEASGKDTINNLQSVFAAFYGVDTSGSDDLNTSIIFAQLKQISDNIDKVQTQCLKEYTTYLLKVQRLAELPPEIGNAAPKSTALKKLQDELTTVTQVCNSSAASIGRYFTALYGPAGTKDYTSLIQSISKGIASGTDPKTALQTVQIGIGITYDQISAASDAMYHQYVQWLPLTNSILNNAETTTFEFIPDQLTANDSSSNIVFRTEGTLSPVYYKSLT